MGHTGSQWFPFPWTPLVTICFVLHRPQPARHAGRFVVNIVCSAGSLWFTHRHHHVRVASEGRRVVAPPSMSTCGRQHVSRGLQSDVWNRFVACRATCSVDDQVGDATCGQEVGWVIRWCGAEPCLPVWRRQVESHAQIPRCVDGIGDETVIHYSQARCCVRAALQLGGDVEQPWLKLTFVRYDNAINTPNDFLYVMSK